MVVDFELFRPALEAALERFDRARGGGCRVVIEHVFAAQKCRLDLVIRLVGLALATARLGLGNLVTNMRRLAWFAARAAPA
jgi:hypothetical protein